MTPSRIEQWQRAFLALSYRRLPRRLRSSQHLFFLTFSGFAIFFLLLLVPMLTAIDQPGAASSALICALVLMLNLCLWRRGLPLVWAHAVYQTALLVIILYNAWHMGGLTSPVMVWMGIVPILPVFTLSRRWGYGWLLVSIALVWLVLSLQLHGVMPMRAGDDTNALYLGALMISLLSFTQILLVLTYDTLHMLLYAQMNRKNVALKLLSRELGEASAHKDRFLATVSHEMRTPLNAVMGYLNLLQGLDGLPTAARDYASGATNASAHLVTVINDLLDYSQILQGQLVLTPQIVPLRQTLTQIHATLLPRATEKGLVYSLAFDGEMAAHVEVDPHRLTQVLLNILGNAIKFTQHGEVLTRVWMSPPDDAQGAAWLHMAVRDTGEGIAPEHVAHIFQPFVQLRTQPGDGDDALRGNGLGLAITRSLVQTQGGRIELQSVPGQGSTFEIHLPVRVVQAPERPSEGTTASRVHPQAMDILIVDDHHVNRLVALSTIRRFLPQARIDEAKNGAEAIEKMSAHVYDLVLMDLVMPDHSGTEVVRIVRQLPPPHGTEAVVALTANIASDAMAECRAVGMRSVLAKPLNPDLLMETVLRFAPGQDLPQSRP